MIQVKISKEKLCVVGHAADSEAQVNQTSRDVCVSVTAMIKMLLAGFDRVCSEQPAMKVSSGKFVVSKVGLPKEALLLIAIFISSVELLVTKYPEYIRLYGEDGQELVPKEDVAKNGVYSPLFPDWRDYQV